MCDYLADMAVMTLRRLGIPDFGEGATNRIRYLSGDLGRDIDGDGILDVDAPSSTTTIADSIVTWASALVQTTGLDDQLDPNMVLKTPLTIYMVGDIVGGNFMLGDNTSLPAETLAALLDQFDASVMDRFTSAGVTPPAYVPVNVIVEGTSSGSYINALSKWGRVVITSTAAGQPSYLREGGSVSFSASFLSRMMNGNYIHPSFAYAQLDIRSHPALVGQLPQLEATGNGIANELADEYVTASMPLEYRSSGDARPRLLSAMGQMSLKDIASAQLWVYADDPEDHLQSVMVVVSPPTGSYESSTVVSMAKSTTVQNRWEATYNGFFGAGTYNVTYVAIDSAGNVGIPISKTVDVTDSVGPLDVTALTATTSPTGQFWLAWAPSESPDTQGYEVYLTPPGGTEYLLANVGNVREAPVLLTSVVKTSAPYVFRVAAYDRTPNRSAGVMVNGGIDIGPPVIQTPILSPFEAISAAGATVTYVVTAVDSYDGPVTASCLPVSGSTFPLGVTTVTCSASDRSGNVASRPFKIVVVDTTPPAITGVLASRTQEATGSYGAVVNFPAPLAVDIVSGALPVTCSPGSGTTFPIGRTNVTCTATDSHRNVASASFSVTVRDTTPPVLTGVPTGLVLDAVSLSGAIASWAPPKAVDKVNGAVPVVCSPSSGSKFPVGSTAVTCSAIDSAGNRASKGFTVSVVTRAPSITCPGAVSAPGGAATCSAPVSFSLVASGAPMPTTTCALGSTPVASGSSFPVGTSSVTCTASNGVLKPATCSFTVSVTNPTIPLSVQSATVAWAKGLTIGKVSLKAAFSRAMPSSTDVIQLTVDGIPVISKPRSAFTCDLSARKCALAANGTSIVLDFTNGTLALDASQVGLSTLDNSNGVDVSLRVGCGAGTQNIVMTPVGSTQFTYRAPPR
jgi:hypothetical protein